MNFGDLRLVGHNQAEWAVSEQRATEKSNHPNLV